MHGEQVTGNKKQEEIRKNRGIRFEVLVVRGVLNTPATNKMGLPKQTPGLYNKPLPNGSENPTLTNTVLIP